MNLWPYKNNRICFKWKRFITKKRERGSESERLYLEVKFVPPGSFCSEKVLGALNITTLTR